MSTRVQAIPERYKAATPYLSVDGAARAIEDAVGRDEPQYLAPLFQIAEANFTRAEDLLCAYSLRWDESVDPVFREYAY